uniref:Uncharacterized protein n=1 Tax=Sinocyclocheilus rhinocerous TaxID=307959 RepID=A0A673LDM0_9TELE
IASTPGVRELTYSSYRYDNIARGRTRVNIGAAFQRWRELKEREGLESDTEFALFLFDRGNLVGIILNLECGKINFFKLCCAILKKNGICDTLLKAIFDMRYDIALSVKSI